MSVKRQATTELNHENWDQEDPSEHEEMGSFKAAPKDVLEKRVIRTAKRRSQAGAAGEEAKKSVFSGFGGFNKSQPSSFEFLANLTNGSKTTNGTNADKPETTSSSLFSSKHASTPGSGLFSIPSTSSTTSKPTFGIPSTQSSLFSASKATPTKSSESTFKIQSSSNDANTDDDKRIPANPPSIFGTSTNANKSPFSSNTGPSSLFKISNTVAPTATKTSNDPDKKPDDSEDKKLKYYAKLKGLNESVSDWIKKHVEETPLCLLTPIFKDYEKYLKEIQDEYQGPEKVSKTPSEEITATEKSNITPSPVKSSFGTTNNDASPSPFDAKPSIFGNQANSSSKDTPGGFSFGISTSSNSTATTTSGGFSFGINSTPTYQQTNMAAISSPFTLTTNTSTGSNGTSAPFSFGTGKPFSFSNIQKPPESATEEKDEDDEPPKVEFTPVVEENCVFDKRCKIFVKKDDNFADKGVGTLYIKKIEETGKHQLLVRANTNLGNVLLNLILVSSLPTQRLGKNNVMLVCIPTPEAKPPPTPVLIRVKTAEEADELLEILNKYKA